MTRQEDERASLERAIKGQQNKALSVALELCKAQQKWLLKEFGPEHAFGAQQCVESIQRLINSN